MRVTQKDIANRLNLSQSLVAGVLGEKPGIWVSSANRERIQQAARDMGYRPNSAARRLRSGKSDSVGLVVTHPEENSLPLEFGGIVTSLSQFLEPLGHEMTVKTFFKPASALAGLREMAQTRTCDAVVLSGPSADVEAQAALLESLKMPFVVIGSLGEPHPHWPQIDFDHLGMMRRSVQHLTGLGHRRIGYLGHDNEEQYAARLEAGFCSALREMTGDQAPEKWIARLGPERDRRTESQMDRWLRLPLEERPTAVVIGASDDATWRGLELSLARAGLRLGEGAGEFAATGLHHTSAPLLFGQAQGFSQTDLGHLMETLCEALLRPLLTGAVPDEPLLRVCPPMRDMDSLRLLDFVEFSSPHPRREML